MNIALECKKAKRTGFWLLFFCGGLLAAAVPVINMAFRSKIYPGQQGTPVQILLDANWQMMAMLNILLAVAGACLLYYTEYADNAMQKLKSLPVKESSVFLGKVVLVMVMEAFVFAIEAGAVAFCSYHWFEMENAFWDGLCKSFGYSFLLMLPCIILSLMISEVCKNMWISLGIGVVCVFTATMLPTNNFILSLFPFAMPFQVFAIADTEQVMHFMYAALAECAIFILADFTHDVLGRV